VTISLPVPVGVGLGALYNANRRVDDESQVFTSVLRLIHLRQGGKHLVNFMWQLEVRFWRAHRATLDPRLRQNLLPGHHVSAPFLQTWVTKAPSKRPLSPLCPPSPVTIQVPQSGTTVKDGLQPVEKRPARSAHHAAAGRSWGLPSHPGIGPPLAAFACGVDLAAMGFD
jgi:hypothetical protein